MQLEIEALSPIRKRVQVTVPSNRVNADFSRAFTRVSKSARLPGFRNGRVPMSHLRKRFGAQVAAEVTEGLVQAGWTQAIDQHNIRPVTQPEVDAKSAKQGKDFEMTFTVEVFPDVDIKPYDQLTVDRVNWIVGDAVLEHELIHVRKELATAEPITDRDVTEDGDILVFDFEGSLDGVPFDGGKAEDFELTLGSGNFIPGFEEQLIGQTVGEPFDITVTFPEDYQAEQLAGKEAVFACKVKTIKVKVVPELGEALAKRMGEPDMDAVRNTVREGIIAHHSRATDNEAKDALKAAIAEAYVALELPETLLKGMIEAKQREQQQKIQELIRDGKTFDEAREAVEGDDLEALVAKDLRTELVIDAVAEKENITVSEHEITLFVEQLVSSMGEYGHQIRAMYRDPNQRAQLQRRMTEDKVLDFLLDNVDVKVVNKDVPAHDHGDDHKDHDHGDGEHEDGEHEDGEPEGAAEHAEEHHDHD